MKRKIDYYEDLALFPTGVELFWFAMLLAGLIAYPFFLGDYFIYLANYGLVHVLVALGLNLLMGYTGQISLGHSGFFAVGSFGTVTLMGHFQFPFLLALPCAALLASFLGFLIGIPALRLEGPYLAIATLGFGLTITQIIGRLDFFGGREGLRAPELKIGPWRLESDRDFYFLCLIIVILFTLFAVNLTRTKVGRAFIAIRDAEIAAQTLGINLLWYKALAFAISAFYTGIAGGLYVFVLRFIVPEMFGLYMSIIFLAMVIVGGLGSIFGSIVGALLLSWLDLELRHILEIAWLGSWLEDLSKSTFSITGVSNIRYIVFGGIMVFIMLFEPHGLYGIWLRIKKYWKTWPF